ncbi:MAG TPA: multidrug effflux MFS transporter [Xanthobacteraceae bacterium]|nr:multidrug effflux MFS transporter [Xanthobacteraceae bacterium]
MSLDAAITAKPTRLEGKPLLFFLTLLAALGMLATNMYLASFPSLGKELAATSAQVKLTLTVFLLGFAGGQLIVGPLSDRYGRRPLLLAGLVVYAATGVFIALSVSIEWMIGLRIAQAVGACTGSVLARAVARDLFSGDALTRSLGLVTTLTAAAPGFSPLIGGLIETYFGWRGTFLLLAFVGVFAATIVWLRVPETHRERDSAPGLGAAFASYLTLLRERSFMVPALATTCAMTGLFAFFASSPGIFIERFGVPPALFGFIPCATVFAVFAGGFSAPRLAKRWPGYRPVLLGLGMMIFGSTVMLGISFANPGMFQVLGALVFFLFGMGIVNPLATVFALRPFPEKAGAASALIGCFQMAGGALGTALVSALPYPALPALPMVMMGGAVAGLLVVWLGGRAGR